MAGALLRLAKRLTPAPLKALVRTLRQEEGRFLLHSYLRPDVHQTTGLTSLDRYPETFAKVRLLLPANDTLRLLSFGCSTGEEVATLRRYFPEAALVGAEANRTRLRRCRQLGLDDRVHFIESRARAIEQHGPYDAIFAMAVLQKLPLLVHDRGVTDISRFYPFAKFDAQLSSFDRWLKPGGLIIIQNTQYRFCDSSIAAGYEVWGQDARLGAGMQQFDRRSQLIVGAKYPDIIFRKNAALT